MAGTVVHVGGSWQVYGSLAIGLLDKSTSTGQHRTGQKWPIDGSMVTECQRRRWLSRKFQDRRKGERDKYKTNTNTGQNQSARISNDGIVWSRRVPQHWVFKWLSSFCNIGVASPISLGLPYWRFMTGGTPVVLYSTRQNEHAILVQCRIEEVIGWRNCVGGSVLPVDIWTCPN